MATVSSGTICIFGAGGPVGAVVAEALAPHYTLRLVDALTIDEILARPAEHPSFPIQRKYEYPHTWEVADITNYSQVKRVVEGCDAVINLAVSRYTDEAAFAVNVMGAFYVMKAAEKYHLKRVIHTGPESALPRSEGDYFYDAGIPDEAPARPGTGLYPLTKHLSRVVVEAFAQERPEMDVLTFLVSRLRPANEKDDRDDNVVIAYSTAWEDLGDAFLCGLRAPPMPQPNETFHICGRLPMGKYSPDKAERLLGWKPVHKFEQFYTRDSCDEF
jgi:nucleoside-diphosphate-sugar epimerase